MASTPSKTKASPEKGGFRQSLSPSALSQSRHGHRVSLMNDGAMSPGLGASAFHPNARMSPRSLSSRSTEVSADAPIKVVVRVRPSLQPSDPGFDLIPTRRQRRVVNTLGDNSVSVDTSTGSKEFLFDHVFEELDRQECIWNYLFESVNSFVKGFNVSILAYGQSGSGKSYTMGTSGPDDQCDVRTMGIIPRAVQALFNSLPSIRTDQHAKYDSRVFSSPCTADKAWTMQVSYVEIYNETFHDLLASDLDANERPLIDIRESKGQIMVGGLRERKVDNMEDILGALNEGSAIRQTDATAINSKSSRSHAIFSLILTQRKDKLNLSPKHGLASPVDLETVTIQSKMHFVDLAGSERMKNTNSSGDRAKEGISINAGLASLGKVISQLSSNPRGSHVSYRDSKLTRLLTDSLGGNAITYFVACLAPQEYHQAETLNTLQYAQRARAIQSRPKIHQLQDEADLRSIIDRLKEENHYLRQRGGSISYAQPNINEAKYSFKDEKARHDHISMRDGSNQDAKAQRHLSYHNTKEQSSSTITSDSNNAAATLEQAWSLISHYEETIRALKKQVSSSKLDKIYAEQEVEKLKHEWSQGVNEKDYSRDSFAEPVVKDSQKFDCVAETSDMRASIYQLESALAASNQTVLQLNEQLDEANKERRFRSFGNIELDNKSVQTKYDIDQVQTENPIFEEMSNELQALKEENRILQCLRISPIATNPSNLIQARMYLSEQPAFSPSSQLLTGSSNSNLPSSYFVGDCSTNPRPVFNDISTHKQNARGPSSSEFNGVESTSKVHVLSNSCRTKSHSISKLEDVVLKRQGSLDTATRRVGTPSNKLKSSSSIHGSPSNYTPKQTVNGNESGVINCEIEAIERSSKFLALQVSRFGSPSAESVENDLCTPNTMQERLQKIQSVVEKASVMIQALPCEGHDPVGKSSDIVLGTKNAILSGSGHDDRQRQLGNRSEVTHSPRQRSPDETRPRKFRVR